MQKKRFQLEFDQRSAARLEHLQSRLEAASRAEVIRRALALLDLASQAEARGEKLCVLSKDGTCREFSLV